MSQNAKVKQHLNKMAEIFRAFAYITSNDRRLIYVAHYGLFNSWAPFSTKKASFLPLESISLLHS